jgi:hypothetical protein
MREGSSPGFPSAAECLGHAVTALVLEVDHEANERS